MLSSITERASTARSNDKNAISSRDVAFRKKAFVLPSNKDDLSKRSNTTKRGTTQLSFLLIGILLIMMMIHGLHYLDGGGKKLVRMAASRFWVIMEDWKVYKPIRKFDLNYEEAYPQLKVLEDNYQIVRLEAETLLKIKDKMRPISEVLGTGGIHKTTWTTLFLQWGAGGTIDENAQYAPKTAELLKDIPGVYTAFFSILDGDTHLPPHWGYYKGFVRYHLGVVVPNNNEDKNCWIRFNPDYPFNPEHEAAVSAGNTTMIEGQEKYYWKNGEGVMFDDNYLHEAKNEADEPRVVLFLDVARNMPWYASIINYIMLFVTFRDKAMKEVRRKSVVTLMKYVGGSSMDMSSQVL